MTYRTRGFIIGNIGNLYMRKSIVLLTAILFCLCISACGEKERIYRGKIGSDDEMSAETDDHVSDTADETEDDGNEGYTEMEIEENNRKLMAEVLGIDENFESMKYTLASLTKIGAGKIQSAVFGTNDDGEEYVDIVAEDGTNYRLYLLGGYIVSEIKNLDTGEWPMKSYQ